ncbi:MAG: hypothetical protein K9K81_12495 [Desulfobacteraceae bacterium]|nr:hypothetical protein [Desulfobacteraceae bacterium]
MIIDMHYHIDEPMEPMDRLIAQMDQHGIDRIALIAPMVDPFHVEGAAAKLAALGPEKCMYGTDGPFGYPAADGKYDHGAILSEIRQFPISFADQEKITGKNLMAAAGI